MSAAVETFFYQHSGSVTQFDGELIAHVSSELPTKDRWTEFDLFLSYPDNIWILQGIGRSRVPGETDRYWSVQSDDPADVLQSIVGSEVSRLAKKLIAEALRNLKVCDCAE